jgi:chromosome segregation ATPase
MEAKTPILVAQKKDLHRTLEQNDLLAARCADLERATKGVSDEYQQAKAVADEAEMARALMERENKDLSLQIQHLLRQQQQAMHEQQQQQQQQQQQHQLTDGGSANDNNDHFLLYADVSEMQSKNEQLVRIVRKMELERHTMATAMEKQGLNPDGSLAEGRVSELDTVVTELLAMKAQRERTEEMVLGLIQQRDVLQMTLEQSRGQQQDEQQQQSIANATGTPMSDAAAAEKASADLLWQLQQANAEVERLSTKVDRLLKMETSLEEALSKAKCELSEARISAAHHEGESKFQKERVSRLEEVVSSAQREVDEQTTRIMESERRMSSLQDAIAEKDTALLARQEELRRRADELQEQVVAATTAREAERRAASQLELTKAAVKRRDALEDSMRRVETGLAGRLEEDKVQLALERDALARTVETLRKQSSDKAAGLELRLRAVEDETRALRAQKADLSDEVSRLKQELLREEGNRVAAVEKCGLAEQQLQTVSDKLLSLETKNNLDAVKIRENEQKAAELETAQASLAKATAELQIATEHAANFRAMALGTESAMKELKESGDAGVAKQERAIAALEKKFIKTEEALKHARAENLQLKKGVDSSEESKLTMEHEVQALKEGFAGEKAQLEQRIASLQSHEDALRADIDSFQKLSRADKTKLEKEQKQHEETTKKHTKAEKEVEALKAKLSKALEGASTDPAQAIESAVTAVAEPTVPEAAYQELLTEKDSLEARLTELAQAVAKAEETAVTAASAAGSSDMELKKSSAHLASQIRALQSNETALKGKLSVSEAELERTSALLEAAQRALDASRAANDAIAGADSSSSASASTTTTTTTTTTPAPATKSGSRRTRGQKKGASPADAEATTTPAPKTGGGYDTNNPLSALRSPEGSIIGSLQEQVAALTTQLRSANESKREIQSEMESLVKRLRDAQEQARRLTEAQEPLQSQVRALEADKVALTAERNRESEERATWQERYTTHLRQTPRAGIEEAEYERVGKELADSVKQRDAAVEKMRKLEAQARDLNSVNEQQLQERQLLQSKLQEAQTALKEATATAAAAAAAAAASSSSTEKETKGGGRGKRGKQAAVTAAEEDKEVRRLEKELEAAKSSAANAEKTSAKRYEMLKGMKAKYVFCSIVLPSLSCF